MTTEHHQQHEEEKRIDDPLGGIIDQPHDGPEQENAGSTFTMTTAQAATFLLTGWSQYGIVERAMYHFELMLPIVLPVVDEQGVPLVVGEGEEEEADGLEYVSSGHGSDLKNDGSGSNSSSNEDRSNVFRGNVLMPSYSGILALLECVPSQPSAKLSKHKKKSLKKKLIKFNEYAGNLYSRYTSRLSSYKHVLHEPVNIPLAITPSTRVAFCYETTRLVLCLDATSALTSLHNGQYPIDNVAKIMEIYLCGLVKPISISNERKEWKPIIAVTVIAVFGDDADEDRNKIHLHNYTPSADDVSVLVKNFTIQGSNSVDFLAKKIHSWARNELEMTISSRIPQSCFCAQEKMDYDIFNLRNKESSAQKLLSASRIALDTLPQEARPAVVIATACSIRCEPDIRTRLNEPYWRDIPIHILDVTSSGLRQSSTMKVKGVLQNIQELQSTFNKDALFALCKYTGGIFLDYQALIEVTSIQAGSVPSTSRFKTDTFLVSRRRSVRANALQWYSLFSLSPLTPSPVDSWGRSAASDGSIRSESGVASTLTIDIPSSLLHESSTFFRGNQGNTAQQDRSSFTYSLPLISIKGILSQRIKEGFGVRKYGRDTYHPDKISVHFSLKVMGSVINYEVMFEASSLRCRQIGRAYCRIYVVQQSDLLIGDMLNDSEINSTLTKLARSVKESDFVESFLCREKSKNVTDEYLENVESLERLGYLNHHFRSESFDVVFCDGFHKVISFEGKELAKEYQKLTNTIEKFCPYVITNNKMYLKVLDLPKYTIQSMILVSVTKQLFSRMYTISISFFAIDTKDFQKFFVQLKKELSSIESVSILPKRFDPRQVVRTGSRPMSDIFRHCESWQLRNDPELLPLVCRRRLEIGKFMLCNNSRGCILFMKYVADNSRSILDESAVVSLKEFRLLTYEIDNTDQNIVVRLHMDVPNGHFFVRSYSESIHDIFHTINKTVRRRDRECGEVLQCRSRLLSGKGSFPDVRRLLAYSSSMSFPLRFFSNPRGNINNILLNLTISFLINCSLDISIDISRVNDISEENGQWFLFNLDNEHTCMLNIAPKCEMMNNEYSFKSLFFHSFGIGDLYTTRLDEDTTDDVDQVDQGSNAESDLSLIAAKIVDEHDRNFARAAYLALRQERTSSNNAIVFTKGDFRSVLDVCEENVAAEAYISQPDANDVSKLLRIFENLIRVVPIENMERKHFVFSGITTEDESFMLKVKDDYQNDQRRMNLFNDLHGDYSSEESEDEDEGDESSELSLSQSEVSAMEEESLAGGLPKNELSESNFLDDMSPLFVTIKVNGENMSFQALEGIRSSAQISVSFSRFSLSSKKSTIPTKLHHSFSLAIQRELNKFVAIQQLERLRHWNSLSTLDILTAMKFVAFVHDEARLIPLSVFSRRHNDIYPVSFNFMTEDEILKIYNLYKEELLTGSSLSSKVVSEKKMMFYAASDNTIPFWLFFHFQKSDAQLIVAIYHRNGKAAAKEELLGFQKSWDALSQRVNQALLLESLNITKNASTLLICEGERKTVNDASLDYACPVIFKASFPLNHRCDLSKTILSLGSSVLHQFAVSNRSGFYVYRDEEERVVYMTLNASAGRTVILQVHGIDSVGASVTSLLTNILKRKMMSIALEQLSNLLGKNTYFELKQSDIEFLEGWGPSKSYDFVLPSTVTDPLLICLMLRQNLCGSAYFHRLNDGDKRVREYEENDQLLDVYFDESHFTLFYLNTPTPLDPKFQATSTLTRKGAHLARHSGGGIALFRFQILKGNEKIKHFQVGGDLPSMTIEQDLHKSVDVNENSTDAHREENTYSLLLSVVNTTLNVETLISWIELSINQVISAWIIERHLRNPSSSSMSCEQLISQRYFRNHMMSFEKINPGLPVLYELLSKSFQLPHPAIDCFESTSKMWATSLSQYTFDFLRTLTGRASLEDLIIIRSNASLTGSRIDDPKVVDIKWNKDNEAVRIFSKTTGASRENILDEHFDAPEYICAFGLGCEASKAPVSQSLAVFSEIMLEEGETKLAAIKNSHTDIFSRQRAFIVIVTRSSRKVYLYNFHPKICKEMKERFNELESKHTRPNFVDHLNLRNLRASEIVSTTKAIAGAKSSHGASSQAATHVRKSSSSSPAQLNHDHTSKRIEGQSPTVSSRFRKLASKEIRKPKLVGKSVEGSAIHAQLAARDRASTKLPSRSYQSSQSSKKVPASGLASRSSSVANDTTKAGVSRKQEATKGPSTSSDNGYKTISGKKTDDMSDRDLVAFHNIFRITTDQKQPMKSITLPSLRRGLKIYANILQTQSSRVPVTEITSEKNFISSFWSFCISELYNSIRGVPLQIKDLGKRNDISRQNQNVLFIKIPCSEAAVLIAELNLSNFANLRIWLVNLSPTTKKKIRRKRRGPFLDKCSPILHRLMIYLDLRSLVFNFTMKILRELLFDLDVNCDPNYVRLDGSSLICKIHFEFPTESIRALPNAKSRIFHHAVTFSLFEELTGKSSCKNRLNLMKYTCKHAHQYGIKPINGSSFWFNVQGFDDLAAYCIISEHSQANNKYNMYVICDDTEVSQLDALIEVGRKSVSTEIMVRYDHILEKAIDGTRSIFARAASDARRDSLWTDLSTGNPNFLPSLDDLKELCRKSNYSTVASSDVRLSELMNKDKNTELKLNFRKAMEYLKSTFRWVGSYNLEQASDLFIFFVRSTDTFIIFEISLEGNVNDCVLVNKSSNKLNDKIVTEKLVNSILNWIWSQII